MMVSPTGYIMRFEDADYDTLIKERADLINYITEFEKKEKAGDRSGKDWLRQPSPVVQYQMYLEYLRELCILMKDKYNEEYVWGEKTLSGSAK